MSVALSSCGPLGWITRPTRLPLQPTRPVTEQPWPAMPAVLLNLAQQAAAEAGFPHFEPDACLINRYGLAPAWACTGTKTNKTSASHRVRLLGLPALFQFGASPAVSVRPACPCSTGDVVVTRGGADRLRFHGILP